MGKTITMNFSEYYEIMEENKKIHEYVSTKDSALLYSRCSMYGSTSKVIYSKDSEFLDIVNKAKELNDVKRMSVWKFLKWRKYNNKKIKL